MGNFAENLNLGNRFRPPPPCKKQLLVLVFYKAVILLDTSR